MVQYWCRHCGRKMGEYPGDWHDPVLGLSRLSEEDQQDLVQLDDSGEVATVKILCEHCLPVPWSEKLWYN